MQAQRTAPMPPRWKALVWVVGSAMLIAIAAAALASEARAQSEPADDCVYRSNVTAIIDDSGSTASSDPNRARADVLSLFIDRHNLGQREPRALAAIEFGDVAETIFPPTTMSPANADAMAAAIDDSIDAGAGGTDYNLAFDTANAVNPGADARVFFTDGDHNEGAYEDRHLPGPTTHVLGLNVSSVEGDALLGRIAAETGGFYAPLNDPGEAIAAATRLDAELSCIPVPKQRTTEPPPPGESKVLVRAEVPRSAKTISVVESISGAADADISDLTFLIAEREGRVVYKVKSRGASAPTAASSDNCKIKTKRKRSKRTNKRFKPKLAVSCSGRASFLLTQLEGRGGKALRPALGKKLSVKVKTAEGSFIPFGTLITGQVAQDG